MSKTASLWVLRYLVKIFFTSGLYSMPASWMAVSTMRQPPFGIIARLRGASVCRPTITSSSSQM